MKEERRMKRHKDERKEGRILKHDSQFIICNPYLGAEINRYTWI